MKYGVLSDVHSNLEALDAALAALKASGASGWIVLGDTVGYGADPEACIARLAALEPLYAVSGNHDLAVLGRMDLGWFNGMAADAVLWTRDSLSKPARAWLEALPARVERPDFTVVHGSPRNPAEEYLLTPGQFRENLPYVKVFPCFLGHSHLPLYFQLQEGGKVRSVPVQGKGELKPGKSPCFINPGSVGQPRDADPRAAFGLYDAKAGLFEWKRAPYDVEAAQAKIRAAGLPDFLAARLALGR